MRRSIPFLLGLALVLAVMLAGCGVRLPGPLEVTLPGPLPVTLTDRIGVVVALEAPPEDVQLGTPDGVAALDFRPDALIVTWTGGACDRRVAIELSRAGSPAVFTVSTERDPGGCRLVGILRRVVVVFSGIVNADDFQVGEAR